MQLGGRQHDHPATGVRVGPDRFWALTKLMNAELPYSYPHASFSSVFSEDAA